MKSMNFIIFDHYGTEVGFISAEPLMNNSTGRPMWNVGYAVHPSYRQKGYATDAVNGLTNYLLQNYSIQHVVLDICESNVYSIKVAQKCGFTKPNDRIGYFDMEHPELGMRLKWFKQLAGERTSYFNQAVQYYRQKAYEDSVDAFKNALNEPYQQGTPYTDAQIYSNMGMALSSLRRYNEAFQCLKKAQSLGLNNPSIERELTWLRNNIGLY
jgi:tetratricopeptide (TPR) repeat protein